MGCTASKKDDNNTPVGEGGRVRTIFYRCSCALNLVCSGCTPTASLTYLQCCLASLFSHNNRDRTLLIVDQPGLVSDKEVGSKFKDKYTLGKEVGLVRFAARFGRDDCGWLNSLHCSDFLIDSAIPLARIWGFFCCEGGFVQGIG